MPTLKEIYDRKKEASGQVSTQTRNLAIGFVGIAWALLTAHDPPLSLMAARVNRNLLLWLAVISVIVVGCDLLQYVAATKMAEEAYSRAANSELNRRLMIRNSSGIRRRLSYIKQNS